MKDGMIRNFNISENLVLREHHKAPFSKHGFLQTTYINDHADRLIKQYRIKNAFKKDAGEELIGREHPKSAAGTRAIA